MDKSLRLTFWGPPCISNQSHCGCCNATAADKEDVDINTLNTDHRGLSDSVDVNQVKDELEALEKERTRSENIRISVDKELANAANNTKKIEDVRTFISALLTSRFSGNLAVLLMIGIVMD